MNPDAAVKAQGCVQINLDLLVIFFVFTFIEWQYCSVSPTLHSRLKHLKDNWIAMNLADIQILEPNNYEADIFMF